MLISRFWNNWKSALVIVKPETVTRWHRKGFKIYWRWNSRKTGRPTIDWELPVLDNHSSFWLTINIEYITEAFDKKKQVKFGQKSETLMKFKNINKRTVKHYKFIEGLTNPIVEALKYQECFERKGVSTKAEVGEILGVSRARVVQYLNLLKLPNPIIDFMLENHENKRICQFFTERRLRPLTQIEDKIQCLEKFHILLDEKKGGDMVFSVVQQ